MRKAGVRARKGWNGGKEPELNAEGKALAEHAESCAWCTEHTILHPCDEGRRLYEAFNESLKRVESLTIP